MQMLLPYDEYLKCRPAGVQPAKRHFCRNCLRKQQSGNLLDQPHQLRNPQRQCGYVCYCQKQDKQYGEVGEQRFGDRFNTDFADAAANEQNGANRRGHVAHAHIEDQHNAELDVGHSQAFCDGQEDGSENQDCGRDIHKHADH